MKVNLLHKISSVAILSIALSSIMTSPAKAETNESFEKKLTNVTGTALNSFKLKSFTLIGDYKGDKLLLQKDSQENSRSKYGLNDVMQINGDLYLPKGNDVLSPEELAIESRLGLKTKAPYTHMPLNVYQLIDQKMTKTSLSLTVVNNADQYLKDEIATLKQGGKNWKISLKGKTKDYSWEWTDSSGKGFKTSFILTNNLLTSIKHYTLTAPKKFALKDTTTITYNLKALVLIPKGDLYEYGTFVQDPEYKQYLVKFTTETYLNAIWKGAEASAKANGRTTLILEDIVAAVQAPSSIDATAMYDGAFEVSDTTTFGDKVIFCGVADSEAFTYDINNSDNVGHSYFPSSCLDAGFTKL
jgi:hypothetical protein